MSKTIKPILIFVLVLIIIFSSIFVVGRLLAAGSADNYFNTQLRTRLIKSPTLRGFFALHDEGDARYDYLSSASKEIYINVYAMSGEKIDSAVLQDLTKEIQADTNKPALYRLQNLELPFSPETSVADRDLIFKNHTKQNLQPGELNLVLVNLDQDEPLLLGITYHENGIIIFNQAIKNFTGGNSKTFNPYQLSTILHEFGHQFGLSHNDLPGCLMGAHAETDHIAQSNPNYVVTDFCPAEKSQLHL